jgi:hypothetical protein
MAQLKLLSGVINFVLLPKIPKIIAGLQLGYFLERAGRDYIIFEKNSTAGTVYCRGLVIISMVWLFFFFLQEASFCIIHGTGHSFQSTKDTLVQLTVDSQNHSCRLSCFFRTCPAIFIGPVLHIFPVLHAFFNCGIMTQGLAGGGGRGGGNPRAPPPPLYETLVTN